MARKNGRICGSSQNIFSMHLQCMCTHCGLKIFKENSCRFCHKIKNGMSRIDFYQLAARISTVFPVKNTRSTFFYARVSAHPFCQNIKCIAEIATYKRLRRRALNLDMSDQKVFPIIEEKDFNKMIERPCRFCGVEPANGIDRTNNKIGYKLDNCKPTCFQCNIMKKDLKEKEFVEHLKSVCVHQEIPLTNRLKESFARV